MRKDRRDTYTRSRRCEIKTDVLRALSCRADLRLGAVKSGGSPPQSADSLRSDFRRNGEQRACSQ